MEPVAVGEAVVTAIDAPASAMEPVAVGEAALPAGETPAKEDAEAGIALVDGAQEESTGGAADGSGEALSDAGTAAAEPVGDDTLDATEATAEVEGDPVDGPAAGQSGERPRDDQGAGQEDAQAGRVDDGGAGDGANGGDAGGVEPGDEGDAAVEPVTEPVDASVTEPVVEPVVASGDEGRERVGQEADRAADSSGASGGGGADGVAVAPGVAGDGDSAEDAPIVSSAPDTSDTSIVPGAPGAPEASIAPDAPSAPDAPASLGADDGETGHGAAGDGALESSTGAVESDAAAHQGDGGRGPQEPDALPEFRTHGRADAGDDVPDAAPQPSDAPAGEEHGVQGGDEDGRHGAPAAPEPKPVAEPLVDPIAEPIMDPIAEPAPVPAPVMDPLGSDAPGFAAPAPEAAPLMDPVADPFPEADAETVGAGHGAEETLSDPVAFGNGDGDGDDDGDAAASDASERAPVMSVGDQMVLVAAVDVYAADWTVSGRLAGGARVAVSGPPVQDGGGAWWAEVDGGEARGLVPALALEPLDGWAEDAMLEVVLNPVAANETTVPATPVGTAEEPAAEGDEEDAGAPEIADAVEIVLVGEATERSVAAGEQVSYWFRLTNREADPIQVLPTARNSNGAWGVQVVDAAGQTVTRALSLAGGASTRIVVRVTTPEGVAAGVENETTVDAQVFAG